MPKTLEITTGRHPFQVAIIGVCAISALLMMLTGTTPPSITKALPEGIVGAWLICYIVNSLIALVGMFWRGRLTAAMIIECGGLIGMGATTAVYTSSLALISQWDALGAGGFILAVGVACWWRAGQCVTDSRRVLRAQQQARTHTPTLLAEPTTDDGEERR